MKVPYRFRKSLLYRCLLLVKDRRIRRSIKKYFPDDAAARRKAVWGWLLVGLKANDFYRLQCDLRPWKQIREMVSYYECTLFYSAVNSKAAWKVLGEKYLSYLRFKDLYKRDVVQISEEDVLSGQADWKVRAFMESGHQKVVVKPKNSNKGRGVCVSGDPDEICSLLSVTQGGVLEEQIVQSPDLSAFNASSVNTLRIHTMNYGDGEIEVLWPCLRMGHAGSFVDNAGAGGIFGAIDVTTGTIIGAADEKRHFFEEHPDSHKALIGFAIPQWDDACSLARTAAQKLPEAAFVGWDLALTGSGWVLVEGNHMPLVIWQIAAGTGIRKKFEEMERRTVYKRRK